MSNKSLLFQNQGTTFCNSSGKISQSINKMQFQALILLVVAFGASAAPAPTAGNSLDTLNAAYDPIKPPAPKQSHNIQNAPPPDTYAHNTPKPPGGDKPKEDGGKKGGGKKGKTAPAIAPGKGDPNCGNGDWYGAGNAPGCTTINL